MQIGQISPGIYRNIINVASGADGWTVAAYRQAITRDPNNPILRLNLGGIYYSAKNYNEASRSFADAISLKPDWANAYYNLSYALYQDKQYVDSYLAMTGYCH